MYRSDHKKNSIHNSKVLSQEVWADTRIKKHDRYNFELKIDYKLQKDIKNTHFALDAYFFIPQNLQINTETYSKHKFYSDLTIRSRFKTPQMSLEGINNQSNTLSPISKIYTRLDMIKNGIKDSEVVKRTDYEIRLLGCMVRTNLRDQFGYFIKDRNLVKESESYCDQFMNFLHQITKFQHMKEKLRVDLSVIQIEPEIRQSFDFMDDFIGYQIIRRCTKTLKNFDENMECHFDQRQITQKLIQITEHEQEYRKSFKTHLKINKKTKDESFAYWWGILKKYVQGILYLDFKKKKEKSASIQLFYAVAAGLAMFFSLYFSILVANKYPQNSVPFILAIVFGYMLKDRIKETIRWISDRAVGIMFPDNKMEFIDGRHGKRLGKCRETVHFINWDDIPTSVVHIREASNKSLIERSGKPEKVIEYKRRITLFGNQISSIHDRSGDVNDIVRFNVRNMLQYADDPKGVEPIWNSENQSVEKVPYFKVYHINLVVKLKQFDEFGNSQTFYKKVRVAIDQNGIKSVQKPSFTL